LHQAKASSPNAIKALKSFCEDQYVLMQAEPVLIGHLKRLSQVDTPACLLDVDEAIIVATCLEVLAHGLEQLSYTMSSVPKKLLKSFDVLEYWMDVASQDQEIIGHLLVTRLQHSISRVLIALADEDCSWLESTKACATTSFLRSLAKLWVYTSRSGDMQGQGYSRRLLHAFYDFKIHGRILLDVAPDGCVAANWMLGGLKHEIRTFNCHPDRIKDAIELVNTITVYHPDYLKELLVHGLVDVFSWCMKRVFFSKGWDSTFDADSIRMGCGEALLIIAQRIANTDMGWVVPLLDAGILQYTKKSQQFMRVVLYRYGFHEEERQSHFERNDTITGALLGLVCNDINNYATLQRIKPSAVKWFSQFNHRSDKLGKASKWFGENYWARIALKTEFDEGGTNYCRRNGVRTSFSFLKCQPFSANPYTV
jgi:hypothetical protein